MMFIPLDFRAELVDAVIRADKIAVSCYYNKDYKVTAYRDDEGTKITVSVVGTVIGRHKFPYKDKKVDLMEIYTNVKQDVDTFKNTSPDLDECDRCNRSCCYGCPYAN